MKLKSATPSILLHHCFELFVFIKILLQIFTNETFDISRLIPLEEVRPKFYPIIKLYRYSKRNFMNLSFTRSTTFSFLFFSRHTLLLSFTCKF